MEKLKYLLTVTMVMFSAFISFTACSKDDVPARTEETTDPDDDEEDKTSNQMKITVGSKVFKATLNTNATAKAFKTMLPLTINMTDLNANEKYYNLSRSLPPSPSNPGTIQNGDLMLYGSSTLVLFYKTFSTSYSYTRIGKVDDISGYAAALGLGNVTVTFELE